MSSGGAESGGGDESGRLTQPLAIPTEAIPEEVEINEPDGGNSSSEGNGPREGESNHEDEDGSQLQSVFDYLDGLMARRTARHPYNTAPL